VLVTAGLSVWLFTLLFRTHRSPNFPPGPRPIPIFGNLLELDLENPLADLRRYGNVYSVFIGSKPVVVLNGFQAIKEALVNKGNDFSGRAQDLMVNRAPGVILADYSSAWREQRRFGLMTLRNYGLGKDSMEQRILGEVNTLMKLMEQSLGWSTLRPQLIFHCASSNIISQILFAQQHNYEHEFMKFFVTLFHETSKIINGRWGMLYDSFPFIRFLPLPFRRAFTLFQIRDDSKKTRVRGKPRHLIDCYLDELDKVRDDGSSFSEENLLSLLLDFHFAGTDTTANTLLTAFLYLMNYPQVQERCQKEIDEVLDGKDQVRFEDRHEMHYTQAVLHEVQRVADTVPLHETFFQCKHFCLFLYFQSLFINTEQHIEHYCVCLLFVLQGTLIIPNLSSTLTEEGFGKTPPLQPHNFLNDEGQFVKPENFIPFSNLARMELFLIVVTLLRRFSFIWPEDGGTPDFTLFMGQPRPQTYGMKVQLRPTP
uniref:Cytochrome P450, family 2, subfamily X, polypeptide 9 n=1 Tax=Sphaeramia orbicularis TaxID=375764 RepID=A0A672YAJ9_9TELE